jgi:hypothetical protein
VNVPATLEGDRRAAVLGAINEASADELTIERLVQPFFARWTIFDVTCASPHPHRVHLAIDEEAKDEERIVILTGRRESLEELIACASRLPSFVGG